MHMRKYQPLWIKLKDSQIHKCTVQVHRLIVARVVKAVIKEKDMDLGFKLANESNPVRLAVKRIPLADKKHVRIEFELKPRYGLADIRNEVTLEDLEDVCELPNT